MYLYTMTIFEETESENRSELKLWEGANDKIWIEIGYGDDEPCMNQGIAITKDDAEALIKELTRLIKNLEPEIKVNDNGVQGKQLPPSKVNWDK